MLIPAANGVEYTDWLISGHVGSRIMGLTFLNHMDRGMEWGKLQRLSGDWKSGTRRVDAVLARTDVHYSCYTDPSKEAQ